MYMSYYRRFLVPPSLVQDTSVATSGVVECNTNGQLGCILHQTLVKAITYKTRKILLCAVYFHFITIMLRCAGSLRMRQSRFPVTWRLNVAQTKPNAIYIVIGSPLRRKTRVPEGSCMLKHRSQFDRRNKITKMHKHYLY